MTSIRALSALAACSAVLHNLNALSVTAHSTVTSRGGNAVVVVIAATTASQIKRVANSVHTDTRMATISVNPLIITVAIKVAHTAMRNRYMATHSVNNNLVSARVLVIRTRLGAVNTIRHGLTEALAVRANTMVTAGTSVAVVILTAASTRFLELSRVLRMGSVDALATDAARALAAHLVGARVKSGSSTLIIADTTVLNREMSTSAIIIASVTSARNAVVTGIGSTINSRWVTLARTVMTLTMNASHPIVRGRMGSIDTVGRAETAPVKGAIPLVNTFANTRIANIDSAVDTVITLSICGTVRWQRVALTTSRVGSVQHSEAKLVVCGNGTNRSTVVTIWTITVLGAAVIVALDSAVVGRVTESNSTIVTRLKANTVMISTTSNGSVHTLSRAALMDGPWVVVFAVRVLGAAIIRNWDVETGLVSAARIILGTSTKVASAVGTIITVIGVHTAIRNNGNLTLVVSVANCITTRSSLTTVLSSDATVGNLLKVATAILITVILGARVVIITVAITSTTKLINEHIAALTSVKITVGNRARAIITVLISGTANTDRHALVVETLVLDTVIGRVTVIISCAAHRHNVGNTLASNTVILDARVGVIGALLITGAALSIGSVATNAIDAVVRGARIIVVALIVNGALKLGETVSITTEPRDSVGRRGTVSILSTAIRISVGNTRSRRPRSSNRISAKTLNLSARVVGRDTQCKVTVVITGTAVRINAVLIQDTVAATSVGILDTQVAGTGCVGVKAISIINTAVVIACQRGRVAANSVYANGVGARARGLGALIVVLTTTFAASNSHSNALVVNANPLLALTKRANLTLVSGIIAVLNVETALSVGKVRDGTTHTSSRDGSSICINLLIANSKPARGRSGASARHILWITSIAAARGDISVLASALTALNSPTGVDRAVTVKSAAIISRERSVHANGDVGG